MKTWYVFTKDRYDGPFSAKELQSKLNEGEIHPDMHAWSYGMQDWEIMRNITDFSDFASIPPLRLDLEESEDQEELELASPQLDPMDLLLGLGTEPETPAQDENAPLEEPFELPKPFSRTHSIAYEPPPPKRNVKLLTELKEYREKYSKQAIILAGAGVVLYSLGSFIFGSHLPALNNLSKQDEREIRAAVAERLKDGATAAIGLVATDPLAPEFYVGTNLPNGTKLDLQVDGLSDTLLDTVHVSVHAKMTVKGGLAKSPHFQQENGTPFPRGEYQVSVLSPEGKSLGNKVYFLGGARDPSYDQSLKKFHEKLRAQAHTEIAELKQFVDTLEEQLRSTGDEFQKILENQQASFSSQKARWLGFHRDWIQFEGQLQNSTRSWTTEAAQKNFFYASLYQAVIKADQDVAKVHENQTHYFDLERDANKEAQLASQTSVVQSSLLAIKTKISLAEALPVTANGMPQRTGL